MTLGQNPFNPSRSLPTLAAINRRRTGAECLPGPARGGASSYRSSRASRRAPAIPSRRIPSFRRPGRTSGPPALLPGDAYPNEYPEPSAAPLPRSSAPPPPALAAPALYGIAGRVVNSLTPHTEADPAAVLLQFLAAFGNLVGPAPHCRVGATRHGLNLFRCPRRRIEQGP